MTDDPYERGLKIRREVLGDEHVDRSLQRAGEHTREFQELITKYAWGEIWARPGLDRRTRSCITMTALVALGRFDELAGAPGETGSRTRRSRRCCSRRRSTAASLQRTARSTCSSACSASEGASVRSAGTIRGALSPRFGGRAGGLSG